MIWPSDFSEVAKYLRREAAKPGPLAERAKLIILAEKFEQSAKNAQAIPTAFATE